MRSISILLTLAIIDAISLYFKLVVSYSRTGQHH